MRLVVDPPCLAPAVGVVDVPDVGMAVLDDSVVDHRRRMAERPAVQRALA